MPASHARHPSSPPRSPVYAFDIIKVISHPTPTHKHLPPSHSGLPFRSPVYVFDIIKVIQHLLFLLPDAPPHHTYNLGGPARMSRVDMARAVAAHCGHAAKAIEAVPSAQMGDRRAAGGAGAGCALLGRMFGRMYARCSAWRLPLTPGGTGPLRRRQGPPCATHARHAFSLAACLLLCPPRGYKTPLDISMHVDRIMTEIPVALTPFEEALKEVFPVQTPAAAV